ncbi:MAG: hypothetical protein CTY19_16550 [Methylomonas sp.]|nr:MAG: hypothetical protein CTY19_16550 [Methylomonas sp.]
MRTSYPKLQLAITVIELLITLSIFMILLSIAIPNFSAGIVRNRLTSIANELVASLNYARSEAIRRGQHVAVRKTGANWENGWQIFVDIDRATNASKNVFNAGTDVQITEVSALPETYTLRGNNNFENFIRYQPDGTSNNIGSFAVCQNDSIQGAKLIIVNTSGRVRMAPDTDQDGIPEKDNGAEITGCTSGF